jgi:hypothetical protein
MKSISDPRRPGRVIRSIKGDVAPELYDLTREANYARKAALAAGDILRRYYGGKYEVGQGTRQPGHDCRYRSRRRHQIDSDQRLSRLRMAFRRDR